MSARSRADANPLEIASGGLRFCTCIQCNGNEFSPLASVSAPQIMRHRSGFYIHYDCREAFVRSIPEDLQPEMIVRLINRDYLNQMDSEGL